MFCAETAVPSQSARAAYPANGRIHLSEVPKPSTATSVRRPRTVRAVKGSPADTVSAYNIMAGRIANRIAEMAESVTLVERQPQSGPKGEYGSKKKPRKLEMRLTSGAAHDVSFSPAFLDNTLQRLLSLQQDMLKMTATLSRTSGIDDGLVKSQAAQGAELSRIIAMICAEKARQGA